MVQGVGCFRIEGFGVQNLCFRVEAEVSSWRRCGNRAEGSGFWILAGAEGFRLEV